MKKIVVLDYGLGNVRSVGNALRFVGVEPVVTRTSERIQAADGMVIPGVGAFPQAMSNLSASGMTKEVRAFIKAGKPVLGICLGMQILFETGFEFQETSGLGEIPGLVKRLSVDPGSARLPHVNWSEVQPTGQGRTTVFAGLADADLRFYFVHSYAATRVPDEYLSATVNYAGHTVVAAVQRGNLWGTQFHPEKSGPAGLHILENFIALTA